MKDLQKALEVIRNRRSKADNLSQMTYQKLMDNAEYVEQLRVKNQIEDEVAQALHQHKDTSSLYPQLNREKQKLATIQKQLGCADDAFHPDYFCKKCSDTGYVNGKPCTCLQNELLRQLHVTNTNASYSFATSTDKNNKKLYDLLQQYCAKFPNVVLPNVTISGMVGVGKTYLCNCIYNALVERDVDVTYLNASEMGRLFLQECHAPIEEKYDCTQFLYDCRILIIDDLGSEVMYKNVTVEQLLCLINVRKSNNLATIVSTNLTPGELQERYGERIMSRLLQKDNTLVAEMVGNDNRLQRTKTTKKETDK